MWTSGLIFSDSPNIVILACNSTQCNLCSWQSVVDYYPSYFVCSLVEESSEMFSAAELHIYQPVLWIVHRRSMFHYVLLHIRHLGQWFVYVSLDVTLHMQFNQNRYSAWGKNVSTRHPHDLRYASMESNSLARTLTPETQCKFTVVFVIRYILLH